MDWGFALLSVGPVMIGLGVTGSIYTSVFRASLNGKRWPGVLSKIVIVMGCLVTGVTWGIALLLRTFMWS